jgi:OmpA-OmpF porin, OOP family
MKCNWRRWLWGVVPLLILCWGAVQVERGHVEEELTERAKQALAHAGLSWAAPAFEGRDGVIRGTAWDESEASKAVDAVRSVRGVRSVESKAELVENAEKYVWSASRHNNRVRIMGYAPSTATRQAILGVTKANFPGYEVVDRMTLARGVPSPDTWLAGVSFGLNQLASLKRGEVRLDDLALTVTGEAEDVTGYRAIKTALASNVPKGIKLNADAVMAPVVSPYIWSVERGEGRLLLGGYVPSEAARAELLAAARDAASGAVVTDQMRPGEGAPQGWLAAAQATVRGLLRLESGAAEIRDLALNVSGVAADESRAVAARNGLRSALPPAFKLTEQIKAREPPRLATEPARGAGQVTPAPDKHPQPQAGSTVVTEAERQPLAGPGPQTPGPQTPGPQTPGPQALAPQTPASQTPGPQTLAPQGPAPQAIAPQAPAPQTLPAQPVQPATGAAALPAASPQNQADAARKDETTLAAKAVVAAKSCQTTLLDLVRNGHILFERGSANLEQASFATLSKLPGAIKACPQTIIQIEGHTDIEGTPEANRALSLKRARTVLNYLVGAGVDVHQLESVGYGERRPVAPNDTGENKAKNRRIEFVVRPK